MLVTVLGKFGPYPGEGGGTASYLLRGADTRILLDCGSGAVGRLQRLIPLGDLNAVVLSHLHNDHICDLLPLGYYLQNAGKCLDLYMPFTPCPQFDFVSRLSGFRPIEISERTETIGGPVFTFTRMRHSLVSYACSATDGKRTLFYSGDTSACPQLVPAATGADLLILDCGKEEGGTAPHLSLSEAARIGRETGAPVLASHLNPALKYESLPSVTLAEEGKTYEV